MQNSTHRGFRSTTLVNSVDNYKFAGGQHFWISVIGFQLRPMDDHPRINPGSSYLEYVNRYESGIAASIASHVVMLGEVCNIEGIVLIGTFM